MRLHGQLYPMNAIIRTTYKNVLCYNFDIFQVIYLIKKFPWDKVCSS